MNIEHCAQSHQQISDRKTSAHYKCVTCIVWLLVLNCIEQVIRPRQVHPILDNVLVYSCPFCQCVSRADLILESFMWHRMHSHYSRWSHMGWREKREREWDEIDRESTTHHQQPARAKQEIIISCVLNLITLTKPILCNGLHQAKYSYHDIACPCTP